MKKILILSMVAALTTLAGCKKYLDAVPYSFASTDNFYKTPKDAEMALTGVYDAINAQNIQGQGNVSTFARDLGFILNGGTDQILIGWFADQSALPFLQASFTGDNLQLNNNWFFFYAGINRANYLIEKLEGISGFQNNRKKEIEAEAKLLRGFYHMFLSMMHGGIPVYTTSVQDPKKARQSIQEVYTQVLADFEFAYNNLPNRATITGRANKWTAAGFLAKAYTYLASAKVSGTPDFGLPLNSFAWVNSSAYYQKALDYTTATIQNSGYILIPNYDRLFRETTKSDQYQECLLSAEGANTPGMENWNMIVWGFCPAGDAGVTGASYGMFRPTGEMYKKYETTADFRFGHNLTGWLPNNSPVEVIGGVRYYIPVPLPGHPNTGEYSIGKYRAQDPRAGKNLPNWANAINIPLLRYADVLLLHAEAQYFTGNEAGARSTLAQVRQRALIAGSNINTLTNAYFKSNFVEELLDERARELCFEQWRRFDLARFNKFDATIAAMDPNFGFWNSYPNNLQLLKQNWKSERIWFPIPQAQRELNPNLVQNKGF